MTIDVRERLEYLRGELRAERLSWGEVVELQGLAEHIAPGDVELLEAAGVPEFEGDAGPGASCGSCGADLAPSTSFPWHLPDEDCRAVRKPVVLNYYGEPITPPEHFEGKHVASVPTAGGLPPVCSCGWTRHEVDGRWFELSDHLEDMAAGVER